jgi:hypothetical protein
LLDQTQQRIDQQCSLAFRDVWEFDLEWHNSECCRLFAWL